MTSFNEKTTRMPQFDLLRIVAILIIFNYHFCNELGKHDSIFYEYRNGGWGSVGTCIFFILSGFMIHKTCQNTQLIRYTKKRVLSIYPALWISFLIAYLITSFQKGSFLWGGNIFKIILSFLGFDTYAVYYNVLTYACVGEWFTGMIIFLYASYLVLRILIRKAPLITSVVLFLLYLAESMFAIQPVVPADASIFTGLALFWLGMLFCENTKWLDYSLLKTIVALIVSAAVLFIPLPYIGNVLPWKNLLGIGIFYLLVNSFSLIPYGDKLKAALKYLSSISFIIYLTHHFIILQMLSLMTGKDNILVYFVSLALTLIVSIVINWICQRIKD